MFGYNGKILEVDLSNRIIDILSLDEEGLTRLVKKLFLK
jgi:aldehyde:ferredoxin oxidoreductase